MQRYSPANLNRLVADASGCTVLLSTGLQECFIDGEFVRGSVLNLLVSYREWTLGYRGYDHIPLQKYKVDCTHFLKCKLNRNCSPGAISKCHSHTYIH